MELKELGFEYWSQLSEDEKKVYDKMQEYRNLFSDMLFEKGTITHDYIAVQASVDGDNWFDDVTEIPEQIEYFDYGYIKVNVQKLEAGDGSFDPETITLSVDTDSLNIDSVLLHEMIHLHEHVITDDRPRFYYDAVLWSLYKNLRKYIPSIDDVIDTHIHILSENDLTSVGGAHDLLFLLKSFDLDIKQGYPLGTVFGYGKQEEFKDIEYKRI